MSSAQALANEHADICAAHRLQIHDGAVWDGARRLFNVGYPESGHTLRRMIEAYQAGAEGSSSAALREALILLRMVRNAGPTTLFCMEADDFIARDDGCSTKERADG